MERSIDASRSKREPIQGGLRRAKRIAIATAWIATPLCILYVLLASIGLAWNPYACLTDTVDTVNGLLGYDILVSDTNCDVIGNSDRIRVRISHAGRNEREVIFEYDPMETLRVPSFSADAVGNLLISIAAVATVIRQEHEWRGARIIYSIGREYYPEPEQWPGER